MNTMTVEGNLTADPELRFFPDGTPVVEFTVAHTPRHYNRERQEWVDGTAMFLAVVARGRLAEHAAESLAKGSAAVVSGTVIQENWEAKDGSGRRSRLRLRADTVAVSLRYGPARSERVHGERPAPAQRPAAAAGGGWDAPATTTPQAPAQAAAPGGWGTGDQPPF